jgi:hypothetical protein
LFAKFVRCDALARWRESRGVDRIGGGRRPGENRRASPHARIEARVRVGNCSANDAFKRSDALAERGA